MADKEKWAEFADAMRQCVNDAEAREAMASKIVKYVSDSIDRYDVASLLLPKEKIPIGQTAEYAVRGKLKAYWHEPGSYAPRTRMTQRVFTVPTWMISAHPEYELGQLEAGRYGSAQDQIKMAREAILDEVNARVWNTVSGSVSSGDANYFTCAGSLTRTALNYAIDYVEDQAGGVAAIVGRRNLFSSMLDWNISTYEVGLYSDSMKDQIMKTGKIPVYRGYPIVSLPQWRSGFGKMIIEQNTVLVVGKDIGKYVTSQDLNYKDAIDVDELMWHIHMYTRMGCAVFFPERIGKVVVGPTK